jgi:hypothetical protein
MNSLTQGQFSSVQDVRVDPQRDLDAHYWLQPSSSDNRNEAWHRTENHQLQSRYANPPWISATIKAIGAYNLLAKPRHVARNELKRKLQLFTKCHSRVPNWCELTID